MPLLFLKPFFSNMMKALNTYYDKYMPNVVAEMHPASNISDEAYLSNFSNTNVFAAKTTNGNCGMFTGRSGGYLAVADPNSDFALGSSDFTIEFFVYTNTTVGVATLYAKRSSSSAVMNVVIQRGGSSNTVYFYVSSNGSSWDVANAVAMGNLNIGQVNHVALTRTNGVIRSFVNGVPGGTVNFTGSISSDSSQVSIGGDLSGSTLLSGTMGGIRVSKVARYTSQFSPVPYAMDSSDPYWTKTILAINFASNLTDLKAHVVTPGSSTSVLWCPNSTSGYVSYFNGSAYLSAPTSTRFRATDDFTIEANMYMTSLPSNMYSIMSWWQPGVATGCSLRIYVDNNGLINIGYGSGSLNVGVIGTSSAVVKTNSWNHIVVERLNGILLMWVNGAISQAVSVTGALNVSANPFYIGVDNSNTTLSGYFTGFMSDFRYTNGVSRYPGLLSPVSPITSQFAADASTVLLIHADGTVGSSTFTDVMGNVITNSGVVVSSNGKFGQSMSFSGSAKMTVPYTNFIFGTGDFTVECFMNTTANTSNAKLIGQSPAGVNPNGGWFLESDQGGGVNFVFCNGSSWYNTFVDTAVNDGYWHHIAVQRSNGFLYLYVDYTLRSMYNIGKSQVIGTTSCPVTIGQNSNTGTYYAGLIDEIRVSNVARYPTSFNPPTISYGDYMTADYYQDSTSLKVDLNGSCYDVVSKTSGTPVGTGSQFVSGLFGKMCYTNTPSVESGFTFPASTAWDLSAIDGTIECYAKVVNPAGINVLFGQSTADNDGSWFVGVYSNGSLFVTKNGVNKVQTGAGYFSFGFWHHIAFSKKNGTTSIFIDGNLITSSTTVSFVSSPSNTFRIGGYGAGTGNVYIQDLRFTTGVARYGVQYNPPKGILPIPPQKSSTVYDPYWALTRMYLTMDDATFTDATGLHQATAYGSPTIVSGKIGNALSCNGSSGVLVSAMSDMSMNLAYSNFTVELWVKPTSFPTTGICLVSKRPSYASYSGFFIGCQGGSTTLSFNISSNGSSWDVANAAPIGNWTTGTWQHVALVRNGSTITPYLNGIPGTPVTTTAAIYSNFSPVCIGVEADGKNGFIGLIDGVRITRAARYNGRFTPPTYAFATTN
jgi:hypothetical protein